MSKKATKEAGDRKTLFIIFRPASLPFISKAAEGAGVARSVFIRNAVLAAAEKQNGKKAPEAAEFSAGGRTSLVSTEAKRLGLTVAQLKTKLATEALGGKWTKPGK